MTFDCNKGIAVDPGCALEPSETRHGAKPSVYSPEGAVSCPTSVSAAWFCTMLQYIVVHCCSTMRCMLISMCTAACLSGPSGLAQG